MSGATWVRPPSSEERLLVLPVARSIIGARTVVLVIALLSALIEQPVLLIVGTPLLVANLTVFLWWRPVGSRLVGATWFFAVDLLQVLVIGYVAGFEAATIFAAASALLWGMLAGPLVAVCLSMPLALIIVPWAEKSGLTPWAGYVLGLLFYAAVSWIGRTLGRMVVGWQVLQQQAERAAAMEASTQERLRIARDLHDTVSADLTGALLLLERIEREVDGRTTTLLDEAAQSVLHAHRCVREAIGELRPTWDDPPRQVREAALAVAQRARIDSDVTVDESLASCSEFLLNQVRAIVVELVENVRKHAGSHRVRVRVGRVGDLIVVRVADDGVGMSPGADARGHGMRGIVERAEALGGEARWEPAVQGGTIVTVVLRDRTNADERVPEGAGERR